MNADLNEAINFSLPKAACLVLFELLTTSYAEWRKRSAFSWECFREQLVLGVIAGKRKQV